MSGMQQSAIQEMPVPTTTDDKSTPISEERRSRRDIALSSSAPTCPPENVPLRKNDNTDDLVTLRLLLASGKRHDFQLREKQTICDVKRHVYLNWPKGKWWSLYFEQLFRVVHSGWEAEAVDSESMLRFLHRGRFLEDGEKLESEHLVI